MILRWFLTFFVVGAAFGASPPEPSHSEGEGSFLEWEDPGKGVPPSPSGKDDETEAVIQMFEESGFEVGLTQGEDGVQFCAAEAPAPKPAKKPKGTCCFCEYYNSGSLDAVCAAAPYPGTSAPKDCAPAPTGKAYANRHNLRCNDWLDRQSCDITKKKFALDNGSQSDLNKLKKTFSCPNVRYQHSGHGFGSGTFLTKVQLCLDVCPSCRAGDFDSVGCNTFSRLENVRPQIKKLAEKLTAQKKPLKISLTGHQTVAGPQDSRYQFCIDTGKGDGSFTGEALDKCFPDSRKCNLDGSDDYKADYGVHTRCLDEKGKHASQTCCRQPDKQWLWKRGIKACPVEMEIGVYGPGGGKVVVRRKGKVIGEIALRPGAKDKIRIPVGWIPNGEELDFSAVPDAGYRFCSWGGFGEVWSLPRGKPEGKIKVTSDTAVLATFCPIKK